MKITSANLYKPIYDIINYSSSICPSESRKCGKEGKKELFRYIFIVFEDLSFDEKIKI